MKGYFTLLTVDRDKKAFHPFQVELQNLETFEVEIDFFGKGLIPEVVQV
jgi:hypothetical protein